MKSDELVKALADATSLVLSAGSGEISFERFLEAYGDFYHRCALDGHEPYPDAQLLAALHRAIEFHRKVQENVLGLVYVHGDLDRTTLNRTGRIDLEQARARLSDLCEEDAAQEIAKQLVE